MKKYIVVERVGESVRVCRGGGRTKGKGSGNVEGGGLEQKVAD